MLIASRVERIDGFAPAKLNGRVGSGGEPLRLVWIGDSTGAGVGASAPDRALPRVVAAGLARAEGRAVDLTVLAVSGARVRDAEREQLPQVAAREPDVVVVAIGNNDVTHLTRRGAFRDGLDRLLRGVVAAGPARVVVLGIAEFAATPLLKQPLRMLTGARGHVLDEDVRTVARRHGALYVPIAAETGPAFAADPDGHHARDGFHPSDVGYAAWAAATLEIIVPALRARG